MPSIEIRQDERAAGAEIDVGIRLPARCRTSRSSRRPPGRSDVAIFRNALPKLPWLGNPLPLSVVSKVPLPSSR